MKFWLLLRIATPMLQEDILNCVYYFFFDPTAAVSFLSAHERQSCDSGNLILPKIFSLTEPKQLLHVTLPQSLQIPPPMVSNCLAQIWHFHGTIFFCTCIIYVYQIGFKTLSVSKNGKYN